MYDSRNKDLADKIISYSIKARAGENVMIELFGINGIHLAQEMTRAVIDAGAVPFVTLRDTETERIIRERGTRELWARMRDVAGLPPRDAHAEVARRRQRGRLRGRGR